MYIGIIVKHLIDFPTMDTLTFVLPLWIFVSFSFQLGLIFVVFNHGLLGSCEWKWSWSNTEGSYYHNESGIKLIALDPNPQPYMLFVHTLHGQYDDL